MPKIVEKIIGYTCVLGQVFTGAYADLIRRFLHPEIPRWRTYTRTSYN